MSIAWIIAVVGLNLGLIFVLMAMPLGRREIRRSVLVNASAERLRHALHPLGRLAGWSGEILEAVDRGQGRVAIRLSWLGRDGEPIGRLLEVDEQPDGSGFAVRIVDDTSLDPAFWSSYRETVSIVPASGQRDEGTRVTLSRTDAYRGLAFLIFRWFALRREAVKLRIWAETGSYRRGGAFEHPVTQFGLACLSALILWPFFGLHVSGLALAAALTVVVFLHELGHLAAFRLMGHRNVRMIFVPILGGIAIGGRPYDRAYEIAFVAMMGAGFSAFLVAGAIVLGDRATAADAGLLALACTVVGGFGALFNLANLVPVWKFDGGQSLRQIVPGAPAQAAASFLLLAAFLALGSMVGVPAHVLVAVGAVFAILSVITSGKGVRPRQAMKPMATSERMALGAAFLAIFAIHGAGLVWAAARIS